MSGRGVGGTHAAAGLWPPGRCWRWGGNAVDGRGRRSPCRPWCRRGARPVRARRGQADGHPQGHFGEVSGGCPEPEVPAGRLGAAGPGLAPGLGRCCRLPNSPAWLGGRCLFWWRPRPRAGGAAGCGRRRCTVAGAAAGSPRPGRALPCAPGSHKGGGRSVPVPGARVGPWGWLGQGVPGGCPGCPSSLTLSLPRQCWFWAFL